MVFLRILRLRYEVNMLQAHRAQTYAVMALESGDSIKTVQENLGHHAASFTLDVYGHVSEQMRMQSADRMERLLKNISGA